ncbi:MAG: tRNA preQ1(34) S-adenosylmethionine ribosyltransferase-isomerase QueA [Balneolaceae bacterium]|nr:MAG: tRNA preQ1(34) S-adenosylmethionine ribosyltransferase-isomerase QueA [Balneolaceae bacterium]
MRRYTLSDFDYHLPDELIAQIPATPRDHSRLLVYDRSNQSISDDYFYNIDRYLSPGTSLVVNNSKVEKCRLLFDQGKTEIFVTKTLNPHSVEAMVRPGKKFRQGSRRAVAEGITVETTHIAPDGVRTLQLSKPIDHPLFDPFRRTPFPPYIETEESLSGRYQTLFAKDEGSKAAPTAGLHFTAGLMDKIRDKGFQFAELTLHVGLGTFAPVKTELIEEHSMHSEWYRITPEQAAGLNAARSITAVGTTSLRVLESVAGDDKLFSACSGQTDIFITPGYQFKAADHLITNFHLPKSTLLMLISAFAGFEEVKRLYKHAIEKKYRFYSFGDAMLIL